MGKAGVPVGPVTEKTVRTRVVPSEELIAEQQRSAPDLWDYIESLTPEDWDDHVLYIYRLEPRTIANSNEPVYIDRTYDGMIQLANGQSVPFNADVIKQKFGGRLFRLLLKKGRERITETKLATEAAPIFPEMQNHGGSQPLPSANQGMDGSTQVSLRAMDTIAGRDSEGIRLALDTLKTTADVLHSRLTANPAPPPPVDPLRDKLMDIMLTRLLAPQPDPLETFVKLRELFQPAAKTGVNETLELITSLKNSGLINAGGRSGGLVDLAGQVLPSVANAAVEGMREWRMGLESQERTVATQRGTSVPQRPPALRVVPAVAQPAAPAGETSEQEPRENPGEPVNDNNPPLPWLEMKIVEILKQQQTVDEAVDEVLSFLYIANPSIVPMLIDPPLIDKRLSPGEQGLLQLFQHEPILQQIPVGPRLTEFIKKFIAAAKADAAERADNTKPQVVPPPPKPAS